MARVDGIDVGVLGKRSTVFHRFRGLWEHINGFKVLGNISTPSPLLTEFTLLRSAWRKENGCRGCNFEGARPREHIHAVLGVF